jgi:hypothetical protein
MIQLVVQRDRKRWLRQTAGPKRTRASDGRWLSLSGAARLRRGAL